MKASPPDHGRRELFANTVAAWVWDHLTLVLSVASLPFLTRLLPQQEFGLWATLLSLSALGVFTDFGMGAVLVRRIAANRETAATEFHYSLRLYAVLACILLATLALMTLPEGGILRSFPLYLYMEPEIVALR